jgi:protein-tyrosine phosphatase
MAGVGRTGTFMACMAKRHLSLDGQAAIDWVRQFIPGALESPIQERFVLEF